MHKYVDSTWIQLYIDIQIHDEYIFIVTYVDRYMNGYGSMVTRYIQTQTGTNYRYVCLYEFLYVHMLPSCFL